MGFFLLIIQPFPPKTPRMASYISRCAKTSFRLLSGGKSRFFPLITPIVAVSRGLSPRRYYSEIAYFSRSKQWRELLLVILPSLRGFFAAI
jgi:hypothetical protein